VARRARLGGIIGPPSAAPRRRRIPGPVPEFPEPTIPASSRSEVFLRYLDYFRSRLTDKIEALPAAELCRARLPSGWTPLELLKHLRHVERRWLEWGFEGQDLTDPWADRADDRWSLVPGDTPASLLTDLHDQAARSRAIIESHPLDELGQPGPRWDGADPPTLERILFHLLQEYARHVGHLDIVTELATAQAGELFFYLAERAVVPLPPTCEIPGTAGLASQDPRSGCAVVILLSHPACLPAASLGSVRPGLTWPSPPRSC
jgi:uncharacterized damage-inducible protein DinB